LLGALCLLAEVPKAQAGPMAPDDGCLTDSICRARYNQAVKLFEAGRFETALPEFQAAYERRQMPWLLINIGRTLHRLGRPREALDYYERYKKAETKSDAETQDRLDKYIAQARALAETGPPSTTSPQQQQVEKPEPTTTATTATTANTANTANTATTTTTTTTEQKPIYKKWWFWVAIGGGVAAVVIIGAAAGAAASQPAPLPDNVMKISFTF
jgi:tetratricopeptide (TPR) repeat protein